METMLKEAQTYIQENRNKGTQCPCCDQFAKVYKRTITSTMARWLIELVRNYEKNPEFQSVASSWSLDINRGTGDCAKLLYWGLVERKPLEPNSQKKSSGYWRPTQRGMDFVYDNLKVEKYARIYNKDLLGFTGNLISIKDSLKSHFDYNELMRR